MSPAWIRESRCCGRRRNALGKPGPLSGSLSWTLSQVAPLAKAGEDNEPDKVQDKDTDIAMAQSPFILDFIRCFVLHAPPAGLRSDKVQDKEPDKGKAKVSPTASGCAHLNLRMNSQLDISRSVCQKVVLAL